MQMEAEKIILGRKNAKINAKMSFSDSPAWFF